MPRPTTMRTRKIALADLEAFAAVARHGSFRRAALERGVSTSLLSQTMRRLEEQSGVPLLRRTTRSVALTEAGEYLLGQVRPALDQIGMALDGLNLFRSTSAGTVRINAPAPVAQFVLAPLAAEFLRQHPDMMIEICADAAKTDIVKSGFDAGVRFDGDLAQDMIAVPFGGDQKYCVVAAPSYLALHGAPTKPADLEQHACIRHRFPGGTIFSWCFTRHRQTVKIEPQGPLTVTDAMTAVSAARSGIGIAYVHEGYARMDVSTGTLVTLLEDWAPGIGKPYLYYPRQRQMVPSLRQFIDFLKNAALPQPAGIPPNPGAKPDGSGKTHLSAKRMR